MDNSEELLKAKIKELESRIEVLQSEYEYQKQKLLLEIENREKWAKDAEKAKYDIKSCEDMQKIRDYYEQELKNQ